MVQKENQGLILITRLDLFLAILIKKMDANKGKINAHVEQ